MKSEFNTYGYAFPYYFIDDGDYEREEFNANPRTYIVNHKKVASDAYYKISDENKTAILDLVTEEAKKSIAEVDKFYTTEWRTIKPKGVDGDKTYYLVHEKKWSMGARERTNSIGMNVNKGDVLWVESEGGIYLDVGVGYAFSDPQGLSDEAYAEFKPVKDHNYGTLLVLILDSFTRKPVQAMACIDKGIKITVEQSGYIMLRTNQNDSLKNRGGEFKGIIKRFVLNNN
ncbi:hypothetical protein [Seonamhaeicola marinus]|uniref:Uncharacterized protein n=1 Tax=Seonamhaeicola marinus TaxID=1912246 RepID=A0A5D0HU75_9FLAO|nr:hypothetical protein [Seonamhaeicola marinus]TYA74914.1 hypothetical protein FUA24_16570 [Seonamhaeicola marinus]